MDIPQHSLPRYVQLLTFTQIAQHASDFPAGGLLTQEFLDPNYKPPSRANMILGTTSSLCSLAVAVVALRLWVMRTWPGLSLGKEDYAIIPATVLLVALSGLQLYMTTIGLGRHGYDISMDEFVMHYRLYQPVMQLYYYTMYFAKLSNLFFVWRITPTQNRKSRYVVVTFFFFHTVWTIASSLLNLFACTPVSANWDLYMHFNPKSHCVNLHLLAILTNSVYAVSDFAFLALPVYVVSHLKLPRRTKVGIAFLFSLGLLATAACTAKLYFWARYYQTYDQMWMAVDVLTWAEVECCISVILVSLPTLDVVLVKMVPQRWRDRLRQKDEDIEHKDSILVSERCVSPAKLEFAKQLDPRTRVDNPSKSTYAGAHDKTYESYTAAAEAYTPES